MTALVTSLIFLVVAFWVFQSRIRARFQGYRNSISHVTRKLDRSNDVGASVSIRIWETHPLSIEHVKELARTHGFSFTRIGTDGVASRTVEFIREGRSDD